MNNRVNRCTTLPVKVSPVSVAIGTPVVVNSSVAGIKGVAQNAVPSTGLAVIELAHESLIVRVSVLASTDDTSSPLAGASALALGQAVYINPATGVISKDSGGTFLFGYALGTKAASGFYTDDANILSAGATGSCDVILA